MPPPEVARAPFREEGAEASSLPGRLVPGVPPVVIAMISAEAQRAGNRRPSDITGSGASGGSLPAEGESASQGAEPRIRYALAGLRAQRYKCYGNHDTDKYLLHASLPRNDTDITYLHWGSTAAWPALLRSHQWAAVRGKTAGI